MENNKRKAYVKLYIYGDDGRLSDMQNIIYYKDGRIVAEPMCGHPRPEKEKLSSD